jgi:hypothetical protein
MMNENDEEVKSKSKPNIRALGLEGDVRRKSVGCRDIWTTRNGNGI